MRRSPTYPECYGIAASLTVLIVPLLVSGCLAAAAAGGAYAAAESNDEDARPQKYVCEKAPIAQTSENLTEKLASQDNDFANRRGEHVQVMVLKEVYVDDESVMIASVEVKHADKQSYWIPNNALCTEQ